MNRTLWTLILAFLLQLMAGSVWAVIDLRSADAGSGSPALHCHDQMVHDDSAGQPLPSHQIKIGSTDLLLRFLIAAAKAMT